MPSLREKIDLWEKKVETFFAVKEEKPTFEKEPTWVEISLLALGGGFAIVGGLMHTGLYGIFWPVQYRLGFIFYMLGVLFTGLFFWSLDDNAKRPQKKHQGPPNDAPNSRDKQERSFSDGEEREFPLPQDPPERLAEKQARHEHV